MLYKFIENYYFPSESAKLYNEYFLENSGTDDTFAVSADSLLRRSPDTADILRSKTGDFVQFPYIYNGLYIFPRLFYL